MSATYCSVVSIAQAATVLELDAIFCSSVAALLACWSANQDIRTMRSRRFRSYSSFTKHSTWRWLIVFAVGILCLERASGAEQDGDWLVVGDDAVEAFAYPTMDFVDDSWVANH
eukprot:2015549-Amphidinium_carterae.1